MVIDSRDLQPSNAFLPILVTLSGIIIDFKWPHFEKADMPILVNFEGKFISFKNLQPSNEKFSMSVILSESITLSRELQSKNVRSRILVTPLGIVIECKKVQ